MYSKEIDGALKKIGAEIGDRIKTGEYEGLLMPKIESGDPNALVIKLDNGYNIGVKIDTGKKIELVSKGEKIGHKAKGDSGKVSGAISILGCGGTITSRVEYKTGAVFPEFSPSDLLSSFPELKEFGDIAGRKLFSLLSEDMNSAHWKIIAHEVEKEIKDGARGVVLMHGTDTMGYTSAALSFMLQKLPVPVVLVGAQRSSDRGSSDNKMNLMCASAAASSEIAEVGLCMHATMSDDYCYLHRGTRVRKMHTSRRDAFKSVNASPLAKIDYSSRKVEVLDKNCHKRGASKKVELRADLSDKVALLFTYPGIKPKLIESYSDYDGLVLATTGLGNAPANPFGDKNAYSIIPAVKSLVDSGVVVVNSPQTLYGRLDMNIYTAGRMLDEIGVIGNYCDWLPETAYVKLMWALGQTKDKKKVKELMVANIAGEISERSLQNDSYE
ncbi:Glutamyl-tRNA(Gln) amidotransferase subunit D [Candidatus Gugararchaeum adminiculabundum]|nr:Glutamyl-tRNA(Gln) amidotransferase subunit D [Candidatus Gugararchaeum adminiculabundum]